MFFKLFLDFATFPLYRHGTSEPPQHLAWPSKQQVQEVVSGNGLMGGPSQAVGGPSSQVQSPMVNVQHNWQSIVDPENFRVKGGISDQNDNFYCAQIIVWQRVLNVFTILLEAFSFCLLCRGIFKADEHESLDIRTKWNQVDQFGPFQNQYCCLGETTNHQIKLCQ